MRRFFSSQIGVRKTQVPNLVGLKEPSAISLLSSKLLTYTSAHVNVNYLSQDKDVSSQNVPFETVVPVNSVIPFVYKIYVGITVPNLFGQSRSSAQSIISSAGLVYSGESSTSSGATSGNNGSVSSQSPSSGSIVDAGTSVSYTYYSYTPPPVIISYPVIINEPAPVIISDPAPVIINQPAPVIINQPAPVIISDPAPVIISDPAPVIISDPIVIGGGCNNPCPEPSFGCQDGGAMCAI
jgi:hypothetical protein